MTEEEATFVCEMLTGNLQFFPAKPAAQGLIVQELAKMCDTIEQGIWLATRLCRVFTKWEGIKEMRAVFCSKYLPKDGLQADSIIYIDGIPSERESLLGIEAGKPILALPAGAVASADYELESEVAKLAEARKMAPLPKYYARSPEEKRVHNELRQMFKLSATFGEQE